MMTKQRKNSGFTLAEMLIVVAITIILMGVAFIAVQNHQRSMTRLEFDSIAKEIFVAAQNHLTAAQSQGYLQLSEKSDSKSDERDPLGTHETSTFDTSDERYLVYKAVDTYSTDPQEVQSMLDLMLPFGSIDETVRAGGTYIIRYQPSSGRVLDVFYSLPGKSSMLTVSGVELKGSNYSSLMESGRSDTAAGRSFRERFSGTINSKSVTGVVGWYGGEEGLPIGTRLKDPEIVVHNEEVLWIEVNDNNAGEGSLKLLITGVTSGAQKSFLLNPDSENGQIRDENRVSNGSSGYEIILDDITSEGLHFANLSADDTSKHFIPGEDIIIEAVAYNNEALTNVAYSGKKTTNSLFADLEKKTEGGSTEHIALIENIRHFENLDKTISGFQNDKAVKKQDGSDETITKAKQIKDLDWNSTSPDCFVKAVKTINGVESESPINIYNSSNSIAATNSCFYPVSPAFALLYDGQSHKVSNVTVNHSGAAGLFGTLIADSAVKDLKLIDFDIKSSSGDAGALVGTATDTTITNVLAHNSIVEEKNESTGETTKKEKLSKNIEASGSAGGLIGSASGCNVSGCAAALYVKSTGTDASAGGLIGSVSDGTVTASYSGGHTKDGSYDKRVSEGNGYDVTGATAGGLVGSSTAAITNSYSTCSVSGTSKAGGFAGSAGESIGNCYATGLIDQTKTEATVFAFVGSGGANLSGNYFYLAVNEIPKDDDGTEPMLPMSGYAMDADNMAKVKPLDLNAEAYNEFAGAWDDWNDAIVYDAALSKYYGGRYCLRTVDELGSTLPTGYDDWDQLFVSTHYGDWPSPEVFFINTATSS